MADLSEAYNILQGAMAASGRVFLLLDTEPEVPEPESPWRCENVLGAVAFGDVWFSYKEGEPVLRLGYSFSVVPV